MLVLSRKLHEEIIIGGDIRIQIIAIRGDNVRLAITAPPEVQVHRKEIFDMMNKGKAGQNQ